MNEDDTVDDRERPVFNNDIFPDEGLIHDSLKPLARHAALKKTFEDYDGKARRHKEAMIRNGLLSLALGGAAIIGMILGTLCPSLGWSVPSTLMIPFELFALAAILIIAYDAVKTKHRENWLKNAFRRERLRHWHFQVFLDGEFVGRFVSTPQGRNAALAQLDDDLKRFCGKLDEHGAYTEFRRERRQRNGLGATRNKVKQYTDVDAAKRVFDLLRDLRLEVQLRYTCGQLEETHRGGKLPLKVQDRWVESISQMSLLGAVAIPVIQLVLLGIGLTGDHSSFSHAHACLSTAGFTLIAVSAIARAYRTGKTLPEEIEHYAQYHSTLLHFQERFDTIYEGIPGNVTDDNRKQALQRCNDLHELMVEFELEAERELQRFLNLKEKATFLA